MHDFSDWVGDRIEETSAPLTKMPERGDIVIKQPSAIFWDSRKPKSSWVKCPSNRNLDKSSMTMFIVTGDQDKDGQFPVINTSRASSRSRKKTSLDPDNLFDITDIYKPENRKSKAVWLLIPSGSKYREIYQHWQKECQEVPIQENEHYKKLWKMDLSEAKIYGEYPTE